MSDHVNYCTISEDAAAVYAEIASACESGWDFSSRWFSTEEDATLVTTRMSKLVPADLNSIMCVSERAMMIFYTIMGE